MCTGTEMVGIKDIKLLLQPGQHIVGIQYGKFGSCTNTLAAEHTYIGIGDQQYGCAAIRGGTYSSFVVMAMIIPGVRK